jgi:hypothetical protein
MDKDREGPGSCGKARKFNETSDSDYNSVYPCTELDIDLKAGYDTTKMKIKFIIFLAFPFFAVVASYLLVMGGDV